MNLFSGELQGVPADATFSVEQGSLEQMMAQRSYQFNARTISTSDLMSGLINQIR